MNLSGSEMVEEHLPSQDDLLMVISNQKRSSVMLIDDDESARGTAAYYLDARGVPAVIAANGFDAMARFRDHQHQISAIVLDMVMPVLNGVDFLNAMQDELSDVRVVICTAYPVFISDVQSRVPYTVLHKPYTRQQFYRRVLGPPPAAIVHSDSRASSLSLHAIADVLIETGLGNSAVMFSHRDELIIEMDDANDADHLREQLVVRTGLPWHVRPPERH